MDKNAYFLLNSTEYLESVKQIVKEALQEHEKSKNSDSSRDSQEKQILTIDQAAEFLSLSSNTLYGYVHKRIIPFIKKRKKLYFFKSALQNWLIEGVQKTKEELGEEMIKQVVDHRNKKS